jgi:hypothetical protein
VSVVIPQSLIEAVGGQIQQVRRIHYVFNGRADTDFGPVELTVGERTFLFDSGPDGESLRIDERPWTDPFTEPLSAENREFVDKSGKWKALDVSTLGDWATLIGASLTEIEWITNNTGKTTGVLLRTEHGGALRLGVMADELFVDSLVAQCHPADGVRTSARANGSRHERAFQLAP